MTAKNFIALYRKAESKLLFNRRQMAETERKAWEIYSKGYFVYSADYEDRLYKENERLAGIMADIERAVSCLSDEREKKILKLRYFDGKSWNRIAEEMCYSAQHVQRIHKKALEKLAVPSEYKEGEEYERFN